MKIQYIFVLSFLAMCNLAIAQWTPITNQVTLTGKGYVTNLLDRGNGSVLAGTNSSGLYMSTDSGTTWKAIAPTYNKLQIYQMLEVGDSIYVATNRGLLVSKDKAARWTLISNGLGTDTVGTALCRTSHGTIIGTTMGSIFTLSDTGTTFLRRRSACSPVTAFIQIGNNVVVGENGCGLYTTSDNGKTWTSFPPTTYSNLNKHITTLYIHNNIVYAGTSNGIYLSYDSCKTWKSSNIGIGNAIVQTSAFAAFNNELYVSFNGGVFSSKNNGKQWSLAQSGLTNLTAGYLGVIGNSIYVVENNLGILAKATLNNSLSGRVIDFGGNPLPGGYVKLFRTTARTMMPASDSVPIDANGNYAFNNIFGGGAYLVQANCNKPFPVTVPTYNDSVTIWSNAKPFTINGKVTKDIHVIGLPKLTGKAVIKGRLAQGTANALAKVTGSGDPIQGVDISIGKRPKPNMDIYALTTTDSTGYFELDSLPIGDYEVFVDIPGLTMQTIYDLTITAQDSILGGCNFLVDSGGIIIQGTLGIVPVARHKATLKGFPNPVNQTYNFTLDIATKSQVSITLVNALGQLLKSIESATLEEGTHAYVIDMASIPAGNYNLVYTIGQDRNSQRIVKVN